MKTFWNNTYLEWEALTQFGLSVKTEGAIGQFGTGLKYALAVILRGGGTVQICTGEDIYRFQTRRHVVRGKAFDIVQIKQNNEPWQDMAINTSLGVNWEPWMAYRELVCNAWDEGGDEGEPPFEATTVIDVDWNELDKIDITDYFRTEWPSTPVVKDSTAEAYLAKDKHAGKIFYKGVFVGKVPCSSLCYNLQGDEYRGQLSEDRTINNLHYIVVSLTYMNWTSEEQCLALWQNLPENGSEAESLPAVPESWRDTLRGAFARGEIVSNYFPRVMLSWERDKPLAAREPTQREALVIQRCLEFLAYGDISITAPIMVYETKEKLTYGKASGGRILINHHTFDAGSLEVLKTIIEEHIHVSTGALDYSRQFQEVSIAIIAKLLQKDTLL